MSEQLDDMTPEDRDDLLAAEYALGVLEGAAWRAAQARVDTDGAFAQRVRAWETRLSALDDDFAPEAPPAHLWPRIEEHLFAPERPQRRRWRGWLWGGVVAAGLAVAVLMIPPAPAPLIARLEADALVFEAVLDDGNLRVARDGPAADTGRDYELWAIGADGVPRSLGLLREAEARISSDLLAQGVTLAVSLEPEGGAPGTAPTGPILALAELQPG